MFAAWNAGRFSVNRTLQNILDTSEGKEGFYKKCGYAKAGSEMQHFFDTEAKERGI